MVSQQRQGHASAGTQTRKEAQGYMTFLEQEAGRGPVNALFTASDAGDYR